MDVPNTEKNKKARCEWRSAKVVGADTSRLGVKLPPMSEKEWNKTSHGALFCRLKVVAIVAVAQTSALDVEALFTKETELLHESCVEIDIGFPVKVELLQGSQVAALRQTAANILESIPAAGWIKKTYKTFKVATKSLLSLPSAMAVLDYAVDLGVDYVTRNSVEKFFNIPFALCSKEEYQQFLLIRVVAMQAALNITSESEDMKHVYKKMFEDANFCGHSAYDDDQWGLAILIQHYSDAYNAKLSFHGRNELRLKQCEYLREYVRIMSPELSDAPAEAVADVSTIDMDKMVNLAEEDLVGESVAAHLVQQRLDDFCALLGLQKIELTSADSKASNDILQPLGLAMQGRLENRYGVQVSKQTDNMGEQNLMSFEKFLGKTVSVDLAGSKSVPQLLKDFREMHIELLDRHFNDLLVADVEDMPHLLAQANDHLGACLDIHEELLFKFSDELDIARRRVCKDKKLTRRLLDLTKHMQIKIKKKDEDQNDKDKNDKDDAPAKYAADAKIHEEVKKERDRQQADQKDVFNEFVALMHVPVRQINSSRILCTTPGLMINLAAIDDFLLLFQNTAGAGILRPNCDMACTLRTTRSRGPRYALETGARDVVRLVFVTVVCLVPLLIFILPSYLNEILYAEFAMDSRRLQMSQLIEDPVGALKHWYYIAPA
jgi:hypothetical protein